jgi:UDP-N-acetylglucosamine--N-acetylmuramyl-(pentapeptide) pyrophosphoryl-undecaprenol N-acetylglucosamine transferase
MIAQDTTSKEAVIAAPYMDVILTLPIQRLSLFTLFSFFSSFFYSMGILKKYSPKAVVAFGGYVSAPIGLAAFFSGVPLILHEQTRKVGGANNVLRRFCTLFFTSFPETVGITSAESICVGMLLREELFHPPASLSFHFSLEKPLIYLTGGTTGAKSMNDLLFPIISELLQRYSIIHQTGEPSLDAAMKLKKMLPKEISHRYYPLASVSPADVSWILHHARLIIGRSGMNTVYETLCFGIPAIFIPLPWSPQKEQEDNAKFAASYKTAWILPQNEVTGERVVALVASIEEQYERIIRIGKENKKFFPVTGTTDMVKHIASILPG